METPVKSGNIMVSEKEQKRVADLIANLQHENKVLRNKLKQAREQYNSIKEEMEKSVPKKPIWWHWIMDQCCNEKCSQYGSNCSQGPVHDDLGEDINLFEKVNAYNEAQRSGETDYRCNTCGQKLRMMHRHAIADCNVIVDEYDDPLYKAPLIAGQESGQFLTEEEYKHLIEELKNNPTKEESHDAQ